MSELVNLQAAVSMLSVWLFVVSILALVAIAGLMRAVHLWGELMERQVSVERRVRMLERAGTSKLGPIWPDIWGGKPDMCADGHEDKNLASEGDAA